MIHFNDHALLLNESYRHWMGHYLVEERDPGEVLNAFNQCEFVIVSHGLEDDPVFNYGNVAALRMFGCELPELLQLPSRETVPESDLESRSALAARVGAEGVDQHYTGTRLARNGKQWLIESGVVWKLIDNLGRIHGHAACFKQWREVLS